VSGEPLALAAAALALLVAPGLAEARTIHVRTASDSSASKCTLRDAISAANADAASGACPAGSGADTIDFSFATPATITLGSALPQITSRITIAGPGAGQLTVSGADTYRVFSVGSGAVTISRLAIKNGSVSQDAGGGLLNESAAGLTLDRVTVSGNAATATGANANNFAEGGGIENVSGATLTIERSTVKNNTVTAGGATNQNSPSGGGIMNRGTLTVDRTSVIENEATATASGSATTNANGGGIVNFGVLTVTRSALLGNEAAATGGVSNSANGGAISNANSSAVSLTIDRSTISLNVAKQFAGVVVYQGQNLISGSTIARNNASAGASNLFASSNTTLRDTIVSSPLGPANVNCIGPPTSGGYNLEFGGSNQASCGFSGPGDLSGVDPLLAAFPGDNGGPTSTIALQAGSPAIDAGKRFGVAADQRGEPRPFDFDAIPNPAGGDGSDIGAFELQGAKTATKVTLRASDRKVRKGRKVKLTVRAKPCPGRAHDSVKLYRGSKRVGRKDLSSQCKATFRERMKRTSRFKAKVPADTEHKAGSSARVKVRVRR